MGYTTTFNGRFTLDRPLTIAQAEELRAFADADHREGVGGTPSNYCQWVPSKDGAGIEWDQNEKFYGYVEWLELLIDRFIKPWGYVLSGRVEWQGEEGKDQGVIHVKDNRIRALPNVITEPDPTWKIDKPEPKW